MIKKATPIIPPIIASLYDVGNLFQDDFIAVFIALLVIDSLLDASIFTSLLDGSTSLGVFGVSFVSLASILLPVDIMIGRLW